MNLSRRSFIFGGSAVAVGAGFALSGCNHRIGGDKVTDADPITVGMVDYFDNFDYIGAANPTIVSIGWHIYEALYDINPYTNETYPALATDKPVKIDDLTYEISLREGAKYSNNSKVMAGDVINSFNGAKQKDSVAYLLDFIKGFETAGNNKLRLNLNYPMEGVLEQRLSLVKIAPATASDIDKQSKPIGTGPYQIIDMNGSVGGEVKFMPNTNYNGKLPMPKNPMTWTIPGDGASRSGAIIAGAALVAEDLPLDDIDDAVAEGITVDFVEGFENANFFFQTRKDVFSHREARQAVFYALNTDRLITDKMKGHAAKVDCVLGASNKNYNPASTIYNYNPEKAKQLLASAGLSNVEINFLADTNCWAYKFLDYIVEDLAAVGINCNVTETEFRWNDLDEKLKDTDFDVCMSTLERSLHGANADFLLNYMYYRDTYMNNRTGYSEIPGNKWEEFKTLLNEAGATTGKKQQDLYNKCFNIVAEEAVYYPFLRRAQVTAYDANSLIGFKPLPTGGIYCLGTTVKQS